MFLFQWIDTRILITYIDNELMNWEVFSSVFGFWWRLSQIRITKKKLNIVSYIFIYTKRLQQIYIKYILWFRKKKLRMRYDQEETELFFLDLSVPAFMTSEGATSSNTQPRAPQPNSLSFALFYYFFVFVIKC